jgi:hypothetical protein
MALLRTGRPLSLLLAAGCGPGLDGTATVDLYDALVVCDPAAQTCATADGQGLAPEKLQDTAFMSRPMSQYGEADGYYLYFEAQRPGGAIAVLEIDVPTNGHGAAAGAPRTTYREVFAGTTVFQSSTATGRVVVPAADSCPCQDGLFELRFVDAGADGKLGTADDQERRLDRGHFGPSDGRCLRPGPLSLATPLLVVPLCKGAHPASAGGDGDSVDVDVDADGDVDGDVEVDDSGDAVDTDGGGDEAAADGCASSSSSSGDGCEGDSADSEGCSSGDSGGGCEGADSGGCAGAGEGGGDCHVAGNRGLHGRRTQRALGLLWPLGVVGLVHRWLGRRRRPRA